MQGWRKSNEDAHIAACDFAPGGLSLFAVFDGHGGAEVAKYCKDNFMKELMADENFEAKNYKKALEQTFVKIDKKLISQQGKKDLEKIGKQSAEGFSGQDYAFQAGCTANVVLVTPTHIFCANAGDSRSVLSSNKKAVNLSEDHKPDLPRERSRIVAAGHMVEDGRVDGIIALSRAIGDWEYKSASLDPTRMAVSAFPEVKMYPLDSKVEFLICACDGIWDCMTSQQAVDFVRKAKEKKNSLSK